MCTSNGRLFWTNAPWIYIELTIMGALALTIDRLGIIGRKVKHNVKWIILVVYAAGINIYWMGRPEEYNIIAPYMACICMLVFDYILINRLLLSRKIKMIVAVMVCIVLSYYLSKLPECYVCTKTALQDYSITDYEKVKSYMDNFAKEVPENAEGEAVGLRMIYMSIGRDIESDGLGWGYDEKEFEEHIINKQWIVLDNNKTDIKFLRLVKEIPFGGFNYYLYDNKEYDG